MVDVLDVSRRKATRLVLGVCAVAASGRTASAQSPTLKDFRDEVLAIGRRRYPGSTPPLAAGTGINDLVWGDHHLYLDNLYAGVQALPPAQRETAILDWLHRFSPEAQAEMEAARKATDEWDKAKPLLRPKLQPRAVSRYKQLVWQPFSPDLVIAYTLDLGDKDLYVRKEKLAGWSMLIQDVHDNAIFNLERMSADIAVGIKRPEGAVGALLEIWTGDGYDASRLLLHDLRARLLEALGPSLRASVPARDVLYVWSPGVKDRHDIEDQIRRDAIRMPHPLSDEIFVFDTNGVRVAAAGE